MSNTLLATTLQDFTLKFCVRLARPQGSVKDLMPVFSRIEARTAVFWSSPNGCTMFFSTVLRLGLVPSK